MKKPYLVKTQRCIEGAFVDQEPVFVLARSPKEAAVKVWRNVVESNKFYQKVTVRPLTDGWVLNSLDWKEVQYVVECRKELSSVSKVKP